MNDCKASEKIDVPLSQSIETYTKCSQKYVILIYFKAPKNRRLGLAIDANLIKMWSKKIPPWKKKWVEKIDVLETLSKNDYVFFTKLRVLARVLACVPKA